MGRSNKFIGAHIKLRKRHLLEWDTLAVNQQQVLTLIIEETAKKSSLHSDDKRASADLKNRLAARLVKVMARQREEREQMKLRHQEEEALFEQAAEMPK